MKGRKPPKSVTGTPGDDAVLHHRLVADVDYASIVEGAIVEFDRTTRHVPSGVETVIRDGMAFNLIDRGQLASLLEIARLADLLLEYTESGGAAANRPHEFISLVEELRLLGSVLDAEPGTGEAVGELFRMLKALEGEG